MYILILVGDKNNQPPRVKGERSSDYGSWVMSLDNNWPLEPWSIGDIGTLDNNQLANGPGVKQAWAQVFSDVS